MDCVFCQIAQGIIPTTLIYQDDLVVAFNDLNPKAPQHKLIIPRKHISTLNDVQIEDYPVLSHLFKTAQALAKHLEIDESGYRLVMNCNAAGGQTVFHVHLHLLGGRPMSWPPG